VAAGLTLTTTRTGPGPEGEPHHDSGDKGLDAGDAAEALTEAQDPICMTVETATARYRSDVAGRTTYFCCLRCKETFEQDPSRYLGGRR
jgi:YHS domain-containing protein